MRIDWRRENAGQPIGQPHFQPKCDSFPRRTIFPDSIVRRPCANQIGRRRRLSAKFHVSAEQPERLRQVLQAASFTIRPTFVLRGIGVDRSRHMVGVSRISALPLRSSGTHRLDCDDPEHWIRCTPRKPISSPNRQRHHVGKTFPAGNLCPSLHRRATQPLALSRCCHA